LEGENRKWHEGGIWNGGMGKEKYDRERGVWKGKKINIAGKKEGGGIWKGKENRKMAGKREDGQGEKRWMAGKKCTMWQEKGR
jgi:hypothetical protein